MMNVCDICAYSYCRINGLLFTCFNKESSEKYGKHGWRRVRPGDTCEFWRLHRMTEYQELLAGPAYMEHYDSLTGASAEASNSPDFPMSFTRYCGIEGGGK